MMSFRLRHRFVVMTSTVIVAFVVSALLTE